VRFSNRGLVFFPAAPPSDVVPSSYDRECSLSAKHDSRGLLINKSKRYAAVEIEVANVDSFAATDSACRKWNCTVVDDGSLNGKNSFEINTSPAAGDTFVRQITEICDALAQDGATVNQSCGLHVHVDARDFGHYEVRRLLRIYAYVEDELFDVVAQSRRDNQYCMPCGRAYTRGVLAYKPAKKQRHGRGRLESKTALLHTVYGSDSTKAEPRQEYSAVTRTYEPVRRGRKVVRDAPIYLSDKTEHRAGERYYALNMHSFFHRGTVEARHHHGTVKADKIIGWARVWIGLLDAAAKLSDARLEKYITDAEADTEKPASVSLLKRLLPADVFAWYERRTAELREITRARLAGRVASPDGEQ
jgi:hypothetical protein